MFDEILKAYKQHFGEIPAIAVGRRNNNETALMMMDAIEANRKLEINNYKDDDLL